MHAKTEHPRCQATIMIICWAGDTTLSGNRVTYASHTHAHAFCANRHHFPGGQYTHTPTHTFNGERALCANPKPETRTRSAVLARPGNAFYVRCGGGGAQLCAGPRRIEARVAVRIHNLISINVSVLCARVLNADEPVTCK